MCKVGRYHPDVPPQRKRFVLLGGRLNHPTKLSWVTSIFSLGILRPPVKGKVEKAMVRGPSLTIGKRTKAAIRKLPNNVEHNMKSGNDYAPPPTDGTATGALRRGH